MRWWTFFALLVVSCEQNNTALVVVIEADQAVTDRANRISLVITSQEGTIALSEQFTLTETVLPIRRSIVPRGGDASRVLTITARALNTEGEPLTTARLSRSFVSGQSVEVRLRLYELCLGVNCPEGLTCLPSGGRAECVDANVVTGDDAAVDVARDVGPDAGSEASVDGATCSNGQAFCDNKCVTLSTDTAHCGRCGNDCGADQLCTDGDCVDPPRCNPADPVSCPEGSYCNPTNRLCAPGCEPRVVGTCSNGEVCQNNQCVCAEGYHDCSGRCLANNSVRSCGTSCTPCVLAPNATDMDCEANTCVVSGCAAGFLLSDQGVCESTWIPDVFSAMPIEIMRPEGARYFGEAVSISGNGRRIIVGDSANGTATVFARSQTGWDTESPLVRPQRAVSFGTSVFLSTDGGRAVVGDPVGQNPGGLVALYGASTAVEFTFSRPENSQRFGTAVAASGDFEVIAVGDPVGGAGQSGAVHVFSNVDGTYRRTTLPALADELNFGSSLAISRDGSVLAVGADDTAARGLVVTYRRRGDVFERMAGITTSSLAFNFGASLALSADGGSLAVGDNEGGTVSLYGRMTDQWMRVTTFGQPSDGLRFGASVALADDGNTLAVGDPFGGPRGAVYVYVRETVEPSRRGRWSSPHVILVPGTRARFGHALSLSGDGATLVVGAPSYLDDRGGAYVLAR